MCKKLLTCWQFCIPQHGLSRLMGYLANSRVQWLKNLLIRLFISRYHVNMQEAKRQSISDYVTFNDFFARRLAPGARTLPDAPSAVICPVDGRMSQFGDVSQDVLLQAKGVGYRVQDLLADTSYAEYFRDGRFLTLYLSPKDYHRVHMPMNGRLLETIYVPGSLFSVNPLTARCVPGLFTRNERLISLFETKHGIMAVVMVGAMLVASIHTAWAGKATPNRSRVVERKDYHTETKLLERGQELGHFELGSTVILLFQKDMMTWNELLQPEMPVQFGNVIGTIVST